MTEEARRARDKGEYLTDLLRAYPLFDKARHSVKITTDIDSIEKEDAISRELSKTDGIPPREWTRELILDPGTAHPQSCLEQYLHPTTATIALSTKSSILGAQTLMS